MKFIEAIVQKKLLLLLVSWNPKIFFPKKADFYMKSFKKSRYDTESTYQPTNQPTAYSPKYPPT